MKRNEPVSHIMTTDVATVHTGQKPSEVRAMLADKGIHHVPVVSGDQLVGIISSTDMLKLSLGAYGADQRAVDAYLDHTYKLDDIMKGDVKTLGSHDSVRDAAEILGEGTFHSLPVVDGGKLVGLVTSTDLIKYLHAQY